ncbi:MAG: hypothetical protein IJ315_04325 [Firmicutes bacterium]|nr:hypothetical protein [Bacillota bacterium]
MRQYKTIQVSKRVIDRVRCNCCARLIQDEEYFSAVKHWGYRSPYDTEVHAMDVCTDCYEKWIRSFAVSPVLEEESQSEEGCI